MVGRIVDIGENDRYLKVSRGFLVVCDHDSEVGRIPLDGIQAVISHGFGHTLSQNVLIELSARGVPVVLCNKKHLPHALVWPLDTHHEQTKRINAQIDCKKPLLKRAWQQIVRSKIAMQASVLACCDKESSMLEGLVGQVKSGDVSNVEAWAARLYWKALFGDDFRRDQDAVGLNACLNYGYTLLRSLVARAVAGAGLHPTVAVHHSNRGNAFALVDDLMEPYRPVVDLHCSRLAIVGEELSKESKMVLSRLMDFDLPSDFGVTPLHLHVERLVSSYAVYLLGEREELALPAGLASDA